MAKMQKSYHVDKNYVLGVISSKDKTVSQFCKEIGMNRTNFYVAISKGYKAPRSLVISKIVRALDLNESLTWDKE